MTAEGGLDDICNMMKEMSGKLKDIMNAKLSDPKRIMGRVFLRRRGRMQNQDQDGMGSEDDEDDSMLDYRMLVHESQAGSVIGRGGDRIKDLRDKHRMRVIKVYQMLAPFSTDRVVQMVAEPENAINCLKSVVEAVESAPPRGRREDYDAANCCEANALCYGGWLSREAAEALFHGMPIPRPGVPPGGYGMGNPYMMGNDMGPMNPMGLGPVTGGMPPMGPGGRGPPLPTRGPPGPGRGPMMAGGNPPTGALRSATGGPAPVPPPGAPRGSAPHVGGSIGYGSTGVCPAYGGQSGYDSAAGYDGTSMYGGMDQQAQGNFCGPSFGGSPNSGVPPVGSYGGLGYSAGAPRGVGNMIPPSGMPRSAYGGYGMSNPGAHDDAKVSQWYGGWS